MSSGGIFDLAQKRARLEELDAISQAPEFWNDAERAQETIKERGAVNDVVERFDRLATQLDDALVMVELSEEVGGDPDSLAEADSSLSIVAIALEEMEKLRMLGGEHD